MDVMVDVTTTALMVARIVLRQWPPGAYRQISLTGLHIPMRALTVRKPDAALMLTRNQRTPLILLLVVMRYIAKHTLALTKMSVKPYINWNRKIILPIG